MTRLQDLVYEWSIRTWAFLACAFWAGVLALFTCVVWLYGKEQTSALDRPLGQVSLNELIGSTCGSVLYGAVSMLLGCGALAIFWRGMKKFWCDIKECE